METKSGLAATTALAFSVAFACSTVRAASPPGDNIIGAFADVQGSQCNIPTSATSLNRMYLVAIDRSSSGCYGVEFRVDGFPPAWWRLITPSPASNIAIGDPLAGGCNLALTDCMTGGAILLYTIDFLATTPVVNQPLRADRHSLCWQWCFGPLWVLCDAPVFTKVSLAPFTSYLNAPQDPCLVAVEATTWSQVKNLFR